MRAGLLKEVISVEKPIIKADDYGAEKKLWVNHISNTRANINYSSGNRANENGEIVYTYEVIFTVRVYHLINEYMRIIWKNKKYRILSIEPNRELLQLVIKTELINE